MRAKSLIVMIQCASILRMRYAHVDDVSLHTYIHRYSEFAICYSCIRGSLRLAPNYYILYWYMYMYTQISYVCISYTHKHVFVRGSSVWESV